MMYFNYADSGMAASVLNKTEVPSAVFGIFDQWFSVSMEYHCH